MTARPVKVVLCCYVGVVDIATITIKTVPTAFEAQRYIDKLEIADTLDIVRLKTAIREFVGFDIVSFYYLRREL